MKKTFLFMALMLLIGAQTAAVAQELTVSDIEFIDVGYNDDPPVIILTKEGSVLNVQIMNYSAHPNTEEFVITPKMTGGSDGEPCSVAIGVTHINYSLTCVITTFNVSFNVHGIEANSFYLTCWWYKGMVSLTENEPLELWENKRIRKDGVLYILDNKTKTAALREARFVEGEYVMPSELDYEGETFLLTSINYPAFAYNTSLTSVVIPKSVTNIVGTAFYRCSNLTDLYCHAENVPTSGVNVFAESSVATATLHVPAGSVEEYKTTSPWNEFGSIEALPEEPHQPLPFLEGNPIWVYKFERLNRATGWKNGVRYSCFVDMGDRHFSYYFLGKQKEIEGKVYTMVGEITSRGEDELTVNRWLPVREENGIVYAITDSLPGLIEYDFNENERPYQQVGNECVLYNFSTKIRETLYPQNYSSTVESYDTYQLMDGTLCRVLKTKDGDLSLYEKLGCLFGSGYGIMSPPYEFVYSIGDVYATRLNAYFGDNVMLYKAPDAQEGLCVNDTCWSRDDAEAYVPSYRADPRQEEVFSYIRGLQTGTGIHNLQSQNPVNNPILIYDLQGRRLSGKPARGIYIEGGKKKVK